ncbi:MAG: N-acetylmuramoyl-L-alanine amidase [Acidobacteria bacterium]|nr:N-acetylmuramoyl-L-alanine amidase [Acidobacteriota bacterium]
MKRFVPFVLLAVLVPAITSIVLAQQPSQATLRISAGDRPVATVTLSGQLYFNAGDVVTALGGTITPDSTGFRVTLNNVVAAFGPDSRFGVVRDDLIEMPAPPIVVDGKPYVPWQFFQGFFKRAIDNEAVWDPATRVLAVRAAQRNVVSVQASVTNVQGISKIVLSLSGPAEYGIVKQPGLYTVAFRTPIHAPFAEQSVEDPYVQKLTFAGNELRIQLSAPEVVGDAYKLENPFRIVIDFRKGAAPAPGVPPPAVSRPVDQPGIRTIVIDPGHGGKEVGAIGPSGMYEKDATLAVCRKLALSLGSKLGARVVLTRDDDSVISLDQRTAIANQYKADLFLSVHMNAAVVKGAHGSETYFLSLDASDELAKKAAEGENAVSAAAQPTTSSDLKLILWDLAQQEYLNESSKFASAIQEEMNRATGVQNRGVKQAPFKVLVGATMPAALVEVAFITNPEEESKIKSDAYQNMVVDAITRAVQRYKTDYETRIGVAQPPPAAAPATTTTTTATRTGT